MAIDDLLACFNSTIETSTVFRLYTWSKPTLSCGFHQNIDKRVNLENCYHNNIDIVRRPTGGRELLHDGDLSFSIINYDTHQDIKNNNSKDLFYKACDVIINGLNKFGINASVASKSHKTDNYHNQPCLSAPSQHEVIVNGKKIVPMAQRIYPQSVLVHGSIPLEDSRYSTGELLKLGNIHNIQNKIAKSSINLSQILGKSVNLLALKERLFESFSNVFRGNMIISTISRRELSKADNLKYNWQVNKNISIQT